MIDFKEALIHNLIFQRIIINAENVADDAQTMQVSEGEEETLINILLKPFANVAETLEFRHGIDLSYNPLFNIAKFIYGGGNFQEAFHDILLHLKSVSKHPNIKDGELFAVKFERVGFNKKHYEALGLYKVENKTDFVETDYDETGRSRLRFKQGITEKKLDKACLILFTDEPYTVLAIDNTNKETEYWKHDFIDVELKKDFVNNTNHIMNLTKNFVTEGLPEKFEIEKADQIALLNRSLEYFKSNETFEKEAFEAQVLKEEGLKDVFSGYERDYQAESGMAISDSFQLAPKAVKKQARIFKSVLKLDKNFHIYIHGNRDWIERGTDSDGRKFYKIYFNEEE